MLKSIFLKFLGSQSYPNKKQPITNLVVGQGSTFNATRVRGRGKKKCSVTVGAKSMVECNIYFECDNASVQIGNNTFIGGSSLMCSKKIVIGDDVLIAWGCTILDHNSHAIQFSLRKNDVSKWMEGMKDWIHVDQEEVVVGNKSWIGFNSILLKGIVVGEGAIVGAGSVVTKDVPPWTIVAGNPARIIRQISKNER